MLYVRHHSKWYLFYVKLETMRERERYYYPHFFFSGKITGLKTLSVQELVFEYRHLNLRVNAFNHHCIPFPQQEYKGSCAL